MNRFLLAGVLSMVAIGGANAEHIFNGSPMYHPSRGQIYNIFTPIEFDSKLEHFVMTDGAGYGIADNLTINVEVSGSYDSSDNPEFGKWALNDFAIGVEWVPVVQTDGYHSEAFATAQQIYDFSNGWNVAGYNWTVGMRAGREWTDWLLQMVAQVDYLYGLRGILNHQAWAMTVGLQGQYVFSPRWNVVGGLMFDYDLYNDYYNGERLRLELALNYSLSADNYIGIYTGKDVVHNFDKAPMVFGVRFANLF